MRWIIKSLSIYARGLLLIFCLFVYHGNVISQTKEVVTTEKKELNDKNCDSKNCCKDNNINEQNENTLGEETELEGTWVGVRESYEGNHFKNNKKPMVVQKPFIYVFYKNIVARTDYDDEFGMILTDVTQFSINKNVYPNEIIITKIVKHQGFDPFVIKTTDIFKIEGNMLIMVSGSNSFEVTEDSFADMSDIIFIKKLKKIK